MQQQQRGLNKAETCHRVPKTDGFCPNSGGGERKHDAVLVSQKLRKANTPSSRNLARTDRKS